MSENQFNLTDAMLELDTRTRQTELLYQEINRLRIALSQAKASLDRVTDTPISRLSASWEHLPCPTSNTRTSNQSPFPFGALRRGNSQAIGLSSHLPY